MLLTHHSKLIIPTVFWMSDTTSVRVNSVLVDLHTLYYLLLVW